MRKQSLKQAITLAKTRKSQSLARAAFCLEGCPVGGWAETRQAWRALVDELPSKSDRSYTASEFANAVYTVDFADRYRNNF